MEDLITELESKVKNCHNTNTIFDTRNYVLLDDVIKIISAIKVIHCCKSDSEMLKVKYKPVIKDLQQQLTDANEEYADGKLSEVKWLRHTAFLKGKISALLNL